MKVAIVKQLHHLSFIDLILYHNVCQLECKMAIRKQEIIDFLQDKMFCRVFTVSKSELNEVDNSALMKWVMKSNHC